MFDLQELLKVVTISVQILVIIEETLLPFSVSHCDAGNYYLSKFYYKQRPKFIINNFKK